MINANINKLGKEYLFDEVSRKIRSKEGAIDLSVGDVRLPLPARVVRAGLAAAEELGCKSTFRGYPPSAGYDFFRQAVAGYYERRGVQIAEDEIFVSDGIKSDMSVFLSLLERGKVVLRTPTYPAYVESNAIRGNEIVWSNEPPSFKVDIVVICSPDNPTGRAMSAAELKGWVDYCLSSGAVLLFDAAYEAFVTDGSPRSVFEVAGARECAVEFCSLSKTAGFTGVRCGYTVVPHESGLNATWRRVKSCLTNGVSYITQRMAEYALGQALGDIMDNVRYYLCNAAIMSEALGGTESGGAVNSPYIWLRCGNSQEAFDVLLNEFGIGVTPGVGFGKAGEGFVRIHSFCTRAQAAEAARRLRVFRDEYLRGIRC